MVYHFNFITSKTFQALLFILKALKDILQHLKFVNWRIRGFVFDITNRLHDSLFYDCNKKNQDKSGTSGCKERKIKIL